MLSNKYDMGVSHVSDYNHDAPVMLIGTGRLKNALIVLALKYTSLTHKRSKI